MNFTWWVNRKDPSNQNLIAGGFLGLDNIGVFDRSAESPGIGTIHQSDETVWMCFYSLTMFAIAIELAGGRGVRPVVEQVCGMKTMVSITIKSNVNELNKAYH